MSRAVDLEFRSEDELNRLKAGRRDWRAQDWQDHCGDPNCEDCDGLIPEGSPRLLPVPELLAHLQLNGRSSDDAEVIRLELALRMAKELDKDATLTLRAIQRLEAEGLIEIRKGLS